MLQNTVEEKIVEVAPLMSKQKEQSVDDIMKELDVVTKLGAALTMFEKSNHATPLDVVNPFDEQDRLEREAEGKRIADEKLFQHFVKISTEVVEEALLEEVYVEIFEKGYRELPPILPEGYRRIKPPHLNASKISVNCKKEFAYKKIEKHETDPINTLDFFDDDQSLKSAWSTSLPLPPVNQADLHCRHDSDLSYEVTYRIRTGNRYANKAQEDNYTVSFSNITNLPNPRQPKKQFNGHDRNPTHQSNTMSNAMVTFDPRSDEGAFAGKLLENEDNSREKRLTLSKLGSDYIDKQCQERRLKEPDWMLMQHRLRLNESIHTQKLVTFEIVSMAKTIELQNSEFIMNKPIVRFGTLDACDYTVKCTNNVGGDIRKERSLSKIHCMIYVPLIPPSNPSGIGKGKKLVESGGKRYCKSYDSDSDEVDSDDESDRLVNSKRASQVTIVDNNSCWGTYVVTQSGVKKVPTTIQAGIPLEHGDLICMGITRNGPLTMTAIEANRALLVFRVRTDYYVTSGKIPEFDVGGMIMTEQEKSVRDDRAQYK